MSGAGLSMNGHVSPHMDDAGLCQCPCDECVTRTSHQCICETCPCDSSDGFHS